MKNLNLKNSKHNWRVASAGMLYVLVLFIMVIGFPNTSAAQDSAPSMEAEGSADAKKGPVPISPEVTDSAPKKIESDAAKPNDTDTTVKAASGEMVAGDEPVSTLSSQSPSAAAVKKSTADTASRPLETDLPPKGNAASSGKAKKPNTTAHKSKVKKTPPPPRKAEFYQLPDGLVSLSLNMPVFFRGDKGYDFFTTSDAFVNIGASLGADVFAINRRWILSADLSWMHEKANSRKVLGGEFNSYWTAEAATTGVKLRFRLTRWFSPHVRLWGGVGYTRAEWRDLAAGKSYFKTWAPGGIGGAGIGASIHSPGWKVFRQTKRFPIVSVGMLIEGGYSIGKDVDVESTSDDPGAHPIKTYDVSMGTLSRNAPYFLMSAFLRI